MFFPNKPGREVLLDMLNAHFNVTALQSQVTFGTPLLYDNPFRNTVIPVTVNGGPLQGLVNEMFYNRLDLGTLLDSRNVEIPDDGYQQVSDLLPFFQTEYNIVIQPTDILNASLSEALMGPDNYPKSIRITANGLSPTFRGLAVVQLVQMSVASWVSGRNIDNDFAAIGFPSWESNFPMTGFYVGGVEQGGQYRSINLGLGVHHNGNFVTAGVDNIFDLTVATAETWGIDALVFAGDSLPIHGNLDDFPFIPFIKIILLNPMNGFENIQPLKFIHVPDFNRTGLRTWRVAAQSYIPPAYEYNVGAEYLSRTRIVDEYQPPKNFGSVMSYFNAAIGNNGSHFNQASFEIQLGLENLSGVVQAVESTYFNIRHFFQQSTGTWNLAYNDFVDAEMAVFGAVGGDGFLRMKPNGANISPKNFQGFTFTKGGTSDRFDILTRVVKGDGSVVQDATSLVDVNKDYVLSLSPATENYFVDLIFASEMPMMTTSTQPGLEFSIVDASNNVVATRTLTGTIMFNDPDYGLSFIDDLFITSYYSDYYNPDGAPSGEFNMVQLRLSRADLLYTLLGWEVPPPSSNYRIRLKPFISQSVGRLDLATDPSVETLFGGSIDIVVSET